MITLTTEQAQQIEEALEDIVRVFQFETGTPVEALATIRAARAQEQAEQEPVGRWNWNEAKFEWLTKFDYHKHHMTPLYAAPQPVMQEPVAWAHPSGGYLSARYMKEFATGLEKETYTIPLYAAPQPVSQEYQDHLVNQSFDWAAMAAKHQFMEGYRIGLAEMRERCAVICEAKQSYSAMHANTEFAAVIRSINFEGDTGFRPVSEMVGCAYCNNPLFAGTKCNNCGRITLAEQAEQEPLMDYERINALREGEQNGAEDAYFFVRPENDTPTLRKMFCQGFERGFHKGLKYASPVQQVDLTDDELKAALEVHQVGLSVRIGRIAIAAFKEKNR